MSNVKSKRTTNSSKNKGSKKTAGARKTSNRNNSSRNSNRRTSNTSATVNSVTNGINVIKRAIRENSSVSAAAVKSGYGRNYISDIKARLQENYKSKNITKELYNSFVSVNKQYERNSK